jgi:membrane fusion protein (multidrug efflux system)
VPAALLLTAALYFGPKLIYSFTHESTDDAYVGATIVPVSAQVGGQVVGLRVRAHDAVARGDTLLVIDPTDYANAVAQRRAELASARSQRDEILASIEEQKRAILAARADLRAAAVQESLSAREADRYEKVALAGSVSRSVYDQKRSAWAVDSARVEAARAALERQRATLARLRAQVKLQDDRISEAETALGSAGVQLRRATVTAPVDGVVALKDVDLGQVVEPGAPLLNIVRQDSVYVDANFKETQIHDIRLGQRVEIDVDAYPDVRFEGHVGSFQPGAGAAFSLLPPENSTGNFVKVVRRVPVRIWIDSDPDPAHPLWPGLSAVPHVDTNSPGRAASGSGDGRRAGEAARGGQLEAARGGAGR